MEYLRLIIISGIMLAIAIPLQLNVNRLLKFYDKLLPYSMLREGATYDTTISNFKDYVTHEGKILFVFFPAVILIIPVLFAFEFNYFLNLGIYFGLALPEIMLLCRIKTFGDNNILPETGLGYEPLESYGLSVLSSFWFLVVGFSTLYFTDIPLYIPLVIIILALISSIIPMFPDYINKILPYEIRSEKGAWTLKIIALVAIGIQWIVCVVFYELGLF